MQRPTGRQFVVLWGGALWILLSLAVAEDYVVRAVIAGVVVTGLLYWQLSPRPTATSAEAASARKPDVADRHELEKGTAASPAPAGVGGWLIIPILGLLILGPLVGILAATETGSEASSYSEALGAGVVVAFLIAWGVYVGIALAARWLNAPSLAQAYFFVSALLLLLTGAVEIGGASQADAAGPSPLGQAAGSFIWFLYFTKSKRVKATYGPLSHKGPGRAASLLIAGAIAFVCVLAAVVSYSPPRAPEWNEYTSTAGGFTVMAPGHASESHDPGGVDTPASTTLSFREGEAEFAVVYFDTDWAPGDSDELLRLIESNLIETLDAALTESRIGFSGTARSLEFEGSYGPRSEHRVQGRIQRFGDRVYTALVTAPGPDIEAAANRFLDSLRLEAH